MNKALKVGNTSVHLKVLGATSKYIFFITRLSDSSQVKEKLALQAESGKKVCVPERSFKPLKQGHFKILKRLHLTEYNDHAYLINISDAFNGVVSNYRLYFFHKIVFNTKIAFHYYWSEEYEDRYVNNTLKYIEATKDKNNDKYDFILVLQPNGGVSAYIGKLLTLMPALFDDALNSYQKILISDSVDNLRLLKPDGKAVIDITFEDKAYLEYSGLINKGALLFNDAKNILSCNSEKINTMINHEISFLKSYFPPHAKINTHNRQLRVKNILFNLSVIYELSSQSLSVDLPVFIRRFELKKIPKEIDFLVFNFKSNMHEDREKIIEALSANSILILIKQKYIDIFAITSVSLRVQAMANESSSFDDLYRKVFASGMHCKIIS